MNTGKSYGGRIDTLGLDENGRPVIIEYKRALNENVISQGLYYLDWLLDHKAEFVLLVMEKLGPQAAEEIEWAAPRLVCIAGDFTKYDEHAVSQINRNIELIRYKRYGLDHLVLELVNATTALASDSNGGSASKPVTKGTEKTSSLLLQQADVSYRIVLRLCAHCCWHLEMTFRRTRLSITLPSRLQLQAHQELCLR